MGPDPSVNPGPSTGTARAPGLAAPARAFAIGPEQHSRRACNSSGRYCRSLDKPAPGEHPELGAEHKDDRASA